SAFAQRDHAGSLRWLFSGSLRWFGLRGRRSFSLLGLAFRHWPAAGNCMLNHRVSDSRIDFQHQAAQNRFIEMKLAVYRIDLVGVELEISQPIGPLPLPLDGIRQATFFPQAAGKHLASKLLDGRGNQRYCSPGIASVTVGIEDEHAFVNVLGQSVAPD